MINQILKSAGFSVLMACVIVFFTVHPELCASRERRLHAKSAGAGDLPQTRRFARSCLPDPARRGVRRQHCGNHARRRRAAAIAPDMRPTMRVGRVIGFPRFILKGRRSLAPARDHHWGSGSRNDEVGVALSACRTMHARKFSFFLKSRTFLIPVSSPTRSNDFGSRHRYLSR